MAQIGPTNLFSQELHQAKYRADGESFDDYCVRYARATSDDEGHFRALLDALREQRLLPAGRQQLAVGRGFNLSASNCYVSQTIEDSMGGIMEACTNAALTLRMGGGVGMDFSTIRPKGEPIRGLGLKSYSSGPISFMNIWNSMSATVMSAGHRRGAMMGVLRVDHPDIMDFVSAKADQTSLTNFNISVAVTDAFMEALDRDGLYELRFGGKRYGEARALDVWSTIMERNWDYAEPGVLFVDRANAWNNLWYCETFAATNPCAEEWLPPYGACLLGSFNMVKYLSAPRHLRALWGDAPQTASYTFDKETFARDIEAAVRAFDNVMDQSAYPLPQQAKEQQMKRRMGLGVTGMANCLEMLGHRYGSASYIAAQSDLLALLRNNSYVASAKLAAEKGAFPLYDERYLTGKFINTLPDYIIAMIAKNGIRNALLGAIAPTGTISLTADNVSSGIEPPYALETKRIVHMPEGPREVALDDYAWAKAHVAGKTAYEATPEEHVDVLCAAQRYIDNSVSKTCNVNGREFGFVAFKRLYERAYENGAKGVALFNISGKRFGVLAENNQGAACVIDPESGIKTCEAA